jgi:hypothetical protein
VVLSVFIILVRVLASHCLSLCFLCMPTVPLLHASCASSCSFSCLFSLVCLPPAKTLLWVTGADSSVQRAQWCALQGGTCQNCNFSHQLLLAHAASLFLVLFIDCPFGYHSLLSDPLPLHTSASLPKSFLFQVPFFRTLMWCWFTTAMFYFFGPNIYRIEVSTQCAHTTAHRRTSQKPTQRHTP